VLPYPDTVDRLATALGLHEPQWLQLMALRHRTVQPELADTLPLVGRRSEWRHLQAA
jgi:hypothetical protein